jgi:hypothetical protein
MVFLYVLAVFSFFALFVLFLVLSKTLNNIMNNLIKLQYLFQKELDYKKEQRAISELMQEEKMKAAEPEEAGDAGQNTSSVPNGGQKK